MSQQVRDAGGQGDRGNTQGARKGGVRFLEPGAVRRDTVQSDQAIRSVVERLETIPATIEDNREMLSWLRDEHRFLTAFRGFILSC